MANRLPAGRWSAATDVLWTKYDDSEDWVVWSPLSGEVHLVTAAAQQLWVLAANEPRETAEFVTALAHETRRSIDDEFVALTEETLSFMDEAGLIRPVF